MLLSSLAETSLRLSGLNSTLRTAAWCALNSVDSPLRLGTHSLDTTVVVETYITLGSGET